MTDLNLSEREREEIKGYLDRGQKLPPRYKALLFEQPHAAELIWPGKTSEVTNVVLPFQQIEQIDEPRREGVGVGDLFAWDRRTGRQTGGWTNKLIWGDNKLVLSSLKNGPLRRQIDEAGGLKLVYIDPPFDVGADFSFEVEVGAESLVKEPSVVEDVAYRDTWGRDRESYIAMLYERLAIVRGLLASDGQIYVHCDRRVNSHVRLALDELFGEDRQLNEIIWCYRGGATPNGAFAHKHDTILRYGREVESYFDVDLVRIPYSSASAERLEYQANVFRGDRVYGNYKPNEAGKHPEDWWTIQPIMPSEKGERLGYPTQKPVELIQRIIDSSCPPGGLILDFFCGSGTTLAVADGLRVGRNPNAKAGSDKFFYYTEPRKWVGCDLSRFAIHTSRKRMIGMQRELKAAGKPYRSFEILNLGRYERQYFVGIDPTLPEEQRKALSARKEAEFLQLILQAYKAEPVEQAPPFHGRKNGAFVVVGPIDAPVTRGQVDEAVAAAKAMRATRVDMLGFEFEMGLVPQAQEEARAGGVALTLRHIPKDVFDKRAVEKNQVAFHDVAYVEARPRANGLTVTVELTDFGVFYSQGDIDAMTAAMKAKSTKVQVDRGQVWKVAKDKDGIVTREQLTRHWTDWIDYWAVDFDFESKCELVTITEADGTERQVGTGAYMR